MYRLYNIRENHLGGVIRLSDNAAIPFDMNNIDFSRFINKLKKNEVELYNPDNEKMTESEVTSFLDSYNFN